MNDILKDQYGVLCQKLGDATYRLQLLQSNISELQEQIKALNVLNAQLMAKQASIEPVEPK